MKKWLKVVLGLSLTYLLFRTWMWFFYLIPYKTDVHVYLPEYFSPSALSRLMENYTCFNDPNYTPKRIPGLDLSRFHSVFELIKDPLPDVIFCSPLTINIESIAKLDKEYPSYRLSEAKKRNWDEDKVLKEQGIRLWSWKYFLYKQWK